MQRDWDKLVAIFAFAFAMMIMLVMQGLGGAGCGTSGAGTAADTLKTQRQVVAGLSLAVPAIESARRAAYEQGLKAEPDVKNLPALAAAEAVRAQAMKALIRQLKLSEKIFGDAQSSQSSAPETAKILLWSLADTMEDLLEAFSTGPLPKVPVPQVALDGLKLLRQLAGPPPSILDASVLDAAPDAKPVPAPDATAKSAPDAAPQPADAAKPAPPAPDAAAKPADAAPAPVKVKVKAKPKTGVPNVVR